MRTFRALVLMYLLTAALPPDASLAADKPGTEASEHAVLVSGKAALNDELYKLADKKFRAYIKEVKSKEEKAEGVLLLAQALYGRKRYEEVVELLNKRNSWAARSPHRGGFAYWKTRAQHQLGNYEEALKVLASFEQAFPGDHHIPQALRLRGRCYLDLGRNEEAIADFEAFHRRFSDKPEAAQNLFDWAVTELDMQNEEKAVELLGTLTDRHTRGGAVEQARLLLGRILMGRGQWATAENLLRAVAVDERARVDRRSTAWFALASIYEEQTNWSTAIDALEQVKRIATDPRESIEADVNMGRLLVMEGEVDKGIELTKKSVKELKKDPRAGEILLSLAKLLLRERHFDRSEAEFQHHLEAFSDKQGRAEALKGKGWSLWQLQRYPEAAEAFEKAYALLEDVPEKVRALLKAADSYFAIEQYKQAKEKYAELVQTFPDSPLIPQASFQHAECLALLGELEGAEASFRRIISTYQDQAIAEQSYMRIGLIKEQQGHWEEAIRSYERLMQDYPNGLFYDRALHGRGLVRYRLGFFRDALDDFESIMARYPGSRFAEQARFMRGWCHHLLGDSETALLVCKEFIASYPDSPWAADVLFWLGEYYFNSMAYSVAEEYWLDCAKRYPASPLADKALYWAGRAASGQKEFLRAIEHFNALTKRYPGSSQLVETRFAQGDALSELGQFDSAILAFEEIIEKFPESYLALEAMGRKGDCQFTLGSENLERYKEALASYRAVMDSPSSSPDLKLQARYKMGRCYEKMKSGSDALEQYMDVVYGYFLHRDQGDVMRWLWFTRAAFSAAALAEESGAWREAVKIYKRVIDAGVPAAPDAEKRIQRILFEEWLPVLKSSV